MLSFPYTIRRIDPAKDAMEIADLIKVSFHPWLDQENTEYLRNLRENGLYAREHPLLTKMGGFPYSMDGVVCRDKSEKLLGVINSYYFRLNGSLCCLIANVCVDPDHRSKGIASQMLKAVEQKHRDEGIRSVFLQARLEMPDTVRFYRNKGFCVTDYRDDWIKPVGNSSDKRNDHYQLKRVGTAEMKKFRSRMKECYPDSVLWNLNYSGSLFRPGIAADICTRLTSPVNAFRSVMDADGRICGWAAWQSLSGFADTLWVIPDGFNSGAEYSGMLNFLGSAYKGKKPLKMNVPAGQDAGIYADAGFIHYQTLAWMWKRL